MATSDNNNVKKEWVAPTLVLDTIDLTQTGTVGGGDTSICS